MGFQGSMTSVSALAFGLPAGMGTLPFMIVIFVAMYFLMVVPNQRKQKQWQTMLSSLKSGDKVTTNGGIRGQIVSLKDDAVIIKTQPDNLKLEIARSAIAAVTTDEVAKA
jgi:preprotein translocase subunit YajC